MGLQFCRCYASKGSSFWNSCCGPDVCCGPIGCGCLVLCCLYDGIDDAAVGLRLCRSSSPHGSTVARSHSYAVVLLLCHVGVGVRRPLRGGLQGVPYIWIDCALLGDADVARVVLQLLVHCSSSPHGPPVVPSVSYAVVLLLRHVGGPVSYAVVLLLGRR